MDPLKYINKIVLIDVNKGEDSYINSDVKQVIIEFEDDDRTLKIFVISNKGE